MKRDELVLKVREMNSVLKNLEEKLASYSKKELNTRPNPESWSPLQALYHLFLSEGYALSYCQKKLSFNPSIKKASLLARIRSLLVVGYLSSPLKFKAPKAVNSSAMPDELELSELTGKWLAQRDELITFLEKVPQSYLNTELYKHPFGGRLSLSGMLSFLNAHFKRHQKQALRALPH